LIKNFNDSFITSYNNIYVYNLFVHSSSSTLTFGGGWFGQENFSNSTTSYFINCSSDGNIPVNGGGICGQSVGNGGNLTIIGCSSSGNIATNGGGISGNGTGISGTFIISNCFSTGTIGSNAGGIIGYQSGLYSLSLNTIQNCYSTNIISIGGGGITGAAVVNISVQNCYSLGVVGSGAGGIYGDGINTGNTAINCYTANGSNIFEGTNPGIIQNCYTANGNWSDATANSLLQSSYWISVVSSTPFYLKSFGASPYVLDNIISNNIVQTKSISLNPGDSTPAATVANYKSFQIMSGGDGIITINSTTGVITTTSSTPLGTYTLVIYAVDDYTTTTYILTITAPPPILNVLAQTIPPCCEPNVPELNPQASNYSADVIVNKKGGKTIDKNVEDFYVGVATGQRTAYSQPIFKSYHDYMNYLQGKYK
jgi:hypothetical protein